MFYQIAVKRLRGGGRGGQGDVLAHIPSLSPHDVDTQSQVS